jgi:hypothetical protein
VVSGDRTLRTWCRWLSFGRCTRIVAASSAGGQDSRLAPARPSCSREHLRGLAAARHHRARRRARRAHRLPRTRARQPVPPGTAGAYRRRPRRPRPGAALPRGQQRPRPASPARAPAGLTDDSRCRSMAQQELSRGAVAGINGGYWINLRDGNPNGLSAIGGRLTTSNASACGWRAARPLGDGAAALGSAAARPGDHRQDPHAAGRQHHRIRYMNRRVSAAGDINLYDDQFGDQFLIPAGGLAIWIEGMDVHPAGSSTAPSCGSCSPPRTATWECSPGRWRSSPTAAPTWAAPGPCATATRSPSGVRIVSTNGGGAWPETCRARCRVAARCCAAARSSPPASGCPRPSRPATSPLATPARPWDGPPEARRCWSPSTAARTAGRTVSPPASSPGSCRSSAPAMRSTSTVAGRPR